MTKSLAGSGALKSGWPSFSENLQVTLNRQEENPGPNAHEMALRGFASAVGPADFLD